ncbi:MAG: hypothetical protein PWQ51_555 [Methanolobus sp.]|jgi:hypothetical protein|uniref:hypothetical protein n=1 Tax=Methanolobus sp. TaxID=1874737 RepID=UPI0025836AB7|nr:hypothetical protein [Methanolobus sp.]MDK2832191.1 hypothetical protein [Methanolobus sp.]MDK2938391.1 hypothetical protein [Methanolobus sp.]
MKQRYLIFTLALIVILLAGIHFVNECQKEENARENARIANETKKQMGYISSLQAESERIFSQDHDAQNLLNENTSFRVYEIVHDDSLVEYIYIVGFNLQKVKYSTEPRIANGTVYRFYIDLDNKNVTNGDSEETSFFNQSSNLLILHDNYREDKNGLSFDSEMNTEIWYGVCFPLSNRWMYSFRLEGKHTVNCNSISNKAPSIEYQLKIKKIDTNDNGFNPFYDNDYNPFDLKDKYIRVMSNNNNLSTRYWEDERKKEENTLTLSLPSKTDYPIDWLYTWDISSAVNQTIVFDVDMVVKGWSDTSKPEELYGWRFIIETPPNTYEMTEETMMELGVWPTNGFGGFYPLSTTIVKKGEWLENRNQLQNTLL